MSTNHSEEVAPVLLHRVYAEVLRTHAVALIWMGYQQLNAASFAVAEEDDVTGELVKAMKRVIRNPESPEWVDHYHVQEQVPQNTDAKLGKRRPKMDIEFERSGRGTCPRLGFEAKRLGRGNRVGDYLGDEGLSAFLNGYYPTTHGDAGMLGYVQEQTPSNWSVKLAESLNNNGDKYRVATGGEWHSMDAFSPSPSTCSCHTDISGNRLLVIHVLLPFT